MGNSPATGRTGDDQDDFAEFDGVETLGYRVLGVQPNSPAATAGLVSFFDFLVGANEEMLLGSGEGLDEGEEYDDLDFPGLLQEHKGKIVELLVWNIKSQEKRLVELVPNDDWGGAGLLGVTIRIDNYGGADERLIRVLDVEQDSPASVAGLVPMKDYLLGTTVTGFGSAQVLASVLEQHIDHVVEMYVYNSDSDVVRVVPLMPTFNWGVGRGLLGAEVGTGYLHRLPNSCRSTIGHSVERKVRWMNKVKDASNSTDATATTGEDPKPTDQSLLEMEPHLEMEVEKDENNQHLNPEDVTKQPHQLGKAVMSPPRNGAQQQTQTAAPTAEQPASQASASETTAESQPQQQRASAAPAAETTSEVQQAPILVAPPILSSATSAEAVADLFSKPPPNSSQPPAVSNVPNVPFIPPPPKMHY